MGQRSIFVPLVTVAVEEPNEVLLSLLLADRTLTAAEWAYVDAMEKAHA